jgi:glycosyltransferase involved in cell wall biosynthesis
MVAFDITPLQNGNRVRGIGRYVDGLARGLARQRQVPVQFWGWRDALDIEITPPHSSLLLPRFRLPRNRWSWLIGPWGMRARRRLSSAPLVHITDPRAFLPLAGSTLTTVYDLIPLLDPEMAGNGSERRAYGTYLNRLRRADGIFAISRQTADDLRKHLGIPPPPVWIAPPGVTVPAAEVDEASPEVPYFLYIGSPDPHKNLGTLLDAFARLPALPESLVLVGPWYGPNLAMLADLLGRHPGLKERVDYRGFVTDRELARLIRGATAVVVPSRREGFGLPLAETIAAGGVAIHSRIPVLTEVAQGAALSFDPASSAELAAGLSRLSGDPQLRQELRERAAARAPSLTWQPAMAKTLEVYGALLAGERGGGA